MAREAPKGHLTEIEAARDAGRLSPQGGVADRSLLRLHFRRRAACGAAALPRHDVEHRKINKDEIYLIDSGGQYPDGTTDVTRTMIVGKPSPEMKDRFTRVLKGHIALATMRFPEGTSGAALDAFARKSLWDVGLDYDHGTGPRRRLVFVGAIEGPQNISKRPVTQSLMPA